MWDKIKDRLKEQHGIIVEDDYTRSYAGRHMKAGGAFVWWTLVKGTVVDIGSQWSMTKLLRDKGKWIINEHDLEKSIYPSGKL